MHFPWNIWLVLVFRELLQPTTCIYQNKTNTYLEFVVLHTYPKKTFHYESIYAPTKYRAYQNPAMKLMSVSIQRWWIFHFCAYPPDLFSALCYTEVIPITRKSKFYNRLYKVSLSIVIVKMSFLWSLPILSLLLTLKKE